MMKAAAIFAFVTFVTLFLAAYRSRRSVHLLERYQYCADIFFEDAETLIKAYETPPKIIDMLEFMSKRMSERGAALDFLFVLLRYRREFVKKLNPSSDDVLEFQRTSPALWRIFTRALAAGFTAMTYRGGLPGTLVRHLIIFDAKQHEDRTRDLAAGYREIKHPSNGHAAAA